MAMGGLLCGVLLLAGCAAGSPAVVVPAAPDTTAALSPDSPRPATESVAAPAGAVQPAEDQSASVDAEVDDAVPELAMPAPAVSLGTTDSAAFAQDVPVTAEPPSTEDMSTTDPAAPAPDVVLDDGAVVASVNEPAVDPASAAARPALPPDPGSGMSTIIEGGSNGRLEVALTFDAGADTGYGPQILDYLRDEGIHATFGMTGVWAQENGPLVQRMAAEGHQLINHTWDHASLTGANTGLPAQTPEEVATQLADTEALVRDLTGGYEMRPYFRPPYGDYDAATLGYLYDNGYYLSIWWTCDSHGWAGWGAQEIIDYCTTNIVEDEIMLLHVGAAAAGDFEALPGLIQFFRDNGYAFVTVEQMLQP